MSASRTPLIAGNWKMNKTSREGAEFIQQLTRRLGTFSDREVVVAPPFTGLFEAIEAAHGTGIAVGAQDVFWEPDGAYTGAIAPGMLADMGVSSVIIGHSERRQHFGETNQTTGIKTRAALGHGLSVILCIGETEQQRNLGLTEWVLLNQLRTGIESVEPLEAERLAIAYEPVWAIGTGKSATSESAQMAIKYVRGCVSTALGHEAAHRIRILYGGSVNHGNIDDLMGQPDIDGVLVGGASLQLDAFARIVAFDRPAR
jgi:triosephosphate isomerase (TIM)